MEIEFIFGRIGQMQIISEHKKNRTLFKFNFSIFNNKFSADDNPIQLAIQSGWLDHSTRMCEYMYE